MCQKKHFQIFLTALEKDMTVHPEHTFRASCQQKQIVNKLSEGSIAIVMYFSENYSSFFQSEAQS